MHSVAVFDVHRVFGGHEEGGWFFDAGQIEATAELLAMGKIVDDEKEAIQIRDKIQAVLDEEWNTGDRRFDLSSTISGGKYMAVVHQGWPPNHFPAERPRYE
ncbi:MAG: hypothetical protein DI537_10200 [Stutzerimonas stutzeri]|nr:MAG: hypothetical protein DI537_10200 [Stutzerimonas stutzeri]